jgi:hypothetical protein
MSHLSIYKLNQKTSQILRSPTKINDYINQFNKLRLLCAGKGIYAKLVALKTMIPNCVVSLSRETDDIQLLLTTQTFDILLIEDIFYIKLRRIIKKYKAEHPHTLCIILGGEMFLDILESTYQFDGVLYKHDTISKLRNDLTGILKQKRQIEHNDKYCQTPPF